MANLSEQEARLEVIKALIMSGSTNMLRGNYEDEISRKADPMVAYIMGVKKKPTPKPKAAANSSDKKVDPATKADKALEKKTAP